MRSPANRRAKAVANVWIGGAEGVIHRHLSAGGKHSPGGRMEPGKEPQAAQTPSPQPLDLQQDTTFAVETGGELVLHPGHH